MAGNDTKNHDEDEKTCKLNHRVPVDLYSGTSPVAFVPALASEDQGDDKKRKAKEWMHGIMLRLPN